MVNTLTIEYVLQYNTVFNNTFNPLSTHLFNMNSKKVLMKH